MIGLYLRGAVVCALIAALALTGRQMLLLPATLPQHAQLSTPPSGNATAGKSQAPAPLPVRRQDIAEFSGIVEQALFFPGRRVPADRPVEAAEPAAAPAVAPSAPPPPPVDVATPSGIAVDITQLRLLGVVERNGHRKAYIDSGGRGMGWLAEGEGRDDVAVRYIGLDHVTVVAGGVELQLPLYPPADGPTGLRPRH